MVIKTNSLPDIILQVVQEKGTERPYTGEYDDFADSGTYLCRQCGFALFRSDTKFHSGCGWPSFDEEISGAVKRKVDADGQRTEILCARCDAHLGHVFNGEQFTIKNTRHCVNSLSLDFVTNKEVVDTDEVIVAAGCFWGVQYYFDLLPGVLKTEVGYSGGTKKHPTYHEVCSGSTGHYEVLRIVYDKQKLSLEQVLKYFFETHNPVQHDGQGPDIGEQYKSVFFYYNDEQKQMAERLINQLDELGYRIATKLLPVSTFWRAEDYHQHYYDKNGKQPYCHRYTKLFI